MRQTSRFFSFTVLCAVFAGSLFLQGCATRFEEALGEVQTAHDAVLRFGDPVTVETLPDGKERREWVIDREVNVPGQYVSRDYYLGHDWDGFPVFVTRQFWVPEHSVYYNCNLIVVSNERGVVLERRWRGNSCERLLYHNMPPSFDPPPAATLVPGTATGVTRDSGAALGSGAASRLDTP